MNPKETLKKIKTMLGVQVALESMKLDNGVEIEAEVFEAGYNVFIVQDDEKIALPEGEYTLEDGRVLVASEEGIIGEIKEAQEEEAQEEAPAEPEQPMDEPEMSNVETATPKKVVESISKETHFEKVKELEDVIKGLKEQLALATQVVGEEIVEEEEIVEPVAHNPEAFSSKKITKLENKKTLLTTQDRVFAKLFKK